MNKVSGCGTYRCEDVDCTIPYGFFHCGCGEKTRIMPKHNRPLGWVKGESFLFKRGHEARVRYRALREQPLPALWHEEECGYETPCLVWDGTRGSGGYGIAPASEGQDARPAYRATYEKFVGPIPEGLILDHLCMNPPCVNWRHLEPVTYGENLLRSRINRGRSPVTFSYQMACEIRASPLSDEELALAYGTYPLKIRRIRWNQLWRDPELPVQRHASRSAAAFAQWEDRRTS